MLQQSKEVDVLEFQRLGYAVQEPLTRALMLKSKFVQHVRLSNNQHNSNNSGTTAPPPSPASATSVASQPFEIIVSSIKSSNSNSNGSPSSSSTPASSSAASHSNNNYDFISSKFKRDRIEDTTFFECAVFGKHVSLFVNCKLDSPTFGQVAVIAIEEANTMLKGGYTPMDCYMLLQAITSSQ